MGGTKIAEASPKTFRGVTQIIEQAIKSGATTIHIEPQDQYVVVRYRYGSNLQVGTKLPKSVATAITNHLKKMADLDVNTSSKPQIGTTAVTVGKNSYMLEIATLPVVDGEKTTIHIYTENIASNKLEDLQLWGPGLRALEQALAEPHGIILVADRNMDQLMHTLATIPQVFGSSSLKRAFISDRDASIAGTVHQKTGTQKDSGIRHHLKTLTEQGYQVVLIDAITKRKDALAAIKAAQKGNLVIVGIPADSAVDAFMYFHNLAGDPSAITTIRAVVAQKFIRGLCQYCHEAEPLTTKAEQQLEDIVTISPTSLAHIHKLEQQAKAAGLASKERLNTTPQGALINWQPKMGGCKRCNFHGYGTPIGLFEVYVPSPLFQQQVLANTGRLRLNELVLSEHMIPLKTDGIIKMLRGLVDKQTLAHNLSML